MSIRIVLLAVITAGLSTGCQVLIASITSPSDWISGTGTSISGSLEGISASSGSGGGVAADDPGYGEDVRVYAAATLGSAPAADDFARELGRIALRHGIGDWEATAATFRALGAGAREAGFGEAQLAELLQQLGQDEPDLARALEGWRAASL